MKAKLRTAPFAGTLIELSPRISILAKGTLEPSPASGTSVTSFCTSTAAHDPFAYTFEFKMKRSFPSKGSMLLLDTYMP